MQNFNVFAAAIVFIIIFNSISWSRIPARKSRSTICLLFDEYCSDRYFVFYSITSISLEFMVSHAYHSLVSKLVANANFVNEI